MSVSGLPGTQRGEGTSCQWDIGCLGDNSTVLWAPPWALLQGSLKDGRDLAAPQPALHGHL
jgi:hypothetical protein